MVRATKQVDADQKPTESKQKGAGGARAVWSYASIKDISNRFSLNKEEIKQLFGLSESTQFRYEKQNPILKPAIADRLERFHRIYQQALELFEDEDETQRWFSTPKVSLAGETPLRMIATDAGAKQVEEILYRAEYGMFG